MSVEELEKACRTAKKALLEARGGRAYWVGELSSSALSTATAVSALSLVGRERHAERIERALAWLAKTRNDDGGWGDTIRSTSNISTTYLVLAAFTLAGKADEPLLGAARSYLARAGGVRVVIELYGEDRTFSSPILANLAIAGLADWRDCPALPFHLAALPRWMFRHFGLRVVSYALPALIAVGLAQFTNGKGGNPVSRILKKLSAARALRLLEAVTPPSGGYLEATPITCFVVMGLSAAGRKDHPAVEKNIGFLCAEQCPDGSWKIEKDLAVWLTTLSVNALGEGDAALRDWLLGAQTRAVHPYVGSAPGAWGWTNASGGVPDADDTAGALLALAKCPEPERSAPAALRGVAWLLGIQNTDGGWPTFCKGWRKLPFDRSCADITAHALRAIRQWRRFAEQPLARKMDDAVARGFDYLETHQHADGSWLPLWFGNERSPGGGNPVYGTARVLVAYAELFGQESGAAARGVDFLLNARNGVGWGSIEETALACEALCSFPGARADAAREAGLSWLCREIAERGFGAPAPIGFYFAKLWYFEALYPIIFSVAALRHALEGGLRNDTAIGAGESVHDSSGT